MNMTVALVGVTGYAGSVLYQLLQSHPNVDKILLFGKTNAGKHLSDLIAGLVQFHQADPVISVFDADVIMAKTDLVFFATPAGVTKDIALPFIQAGFPVIDLSGDFRLHAAAAYEKWYHKPAADHDYLAKASYGLVETHQHPAHYIANPGCYATAVLLGLIPLVKEHLIDLSSIIVDAKSGVSGAGKTPSASNHFVSVNDNLSLYKVNQHQHIPEIMQELQLFDPHLKAIQMTTTLLPITRGIMASIYVKIPDGVGDDKAQITEKISQAFENSYQNNPFIKLCGPAFPSIKDVVGSNLTAIGWQYNPVTRTLFVVSVIDNLLKGAAGQAVQNLNQLFGFDPLAGLPLMPALV